MEEKKISKIDIVPAIFIEYREDGNVILKYMQGDETVKRAFQPNLFKEIYNPKYILLGIITGVQYMQLTVCDGTDFEDLFLDKWKILKT